MKLVAIEIVGYRRTDKQLVVICNLKLKLVFNKSTLGIVIVNSVGGSC